MVSQLNGPGKRVKFFLFLFIYIYIYIYIYILYERMNI